MADARTETRTPATPGAPPRRGAVAIGGRRRRGGAWWLVALIAALLLALVLLLVARGGDDDKRSGAPAAAPAAGAPATGANGPALVGGGGVAPTAATGAVAPAGVVGDVLFTESGADLDQAAQQVIANAVAKIRAEHPKSVTVVGYTDTNGDPTANQALSQQRAQAVEAALQQQLPGMPIQLSAAAKGQNEPVAPNDTPQGQQLNRRVAILVGS